MNRFLKAPWAAKNRWMLALGRFLERYAGRPGRVRGSCLAFEFEESGERSSTRVLPYGGGGFN